MKNRKTTTINTDLITDAKEMGDKLLKIRKRSGLSQEEAAWAAGLSVRAYADIERGSVNARIDSVIKICDVFKITPNDILVKDINDPVDEAVIMTELRILAPRDHEKVLRMLQLYIQLCNE
ncbi:MAG: helix-turn-helix domain-containing protein [Lachnospiraceae bacterium]|nr:helix-turn-helix domain-containing protein [Lachnospiraceae bacterium]